MRVSLWLDNTLPADEVLAVARHAEASGWDGLWYADHFMPNDPAPLDTPVLEATAVLAALAVAVPRVRIGSLVLGNTYRHPAVVANVAATLDRLSGGRFVLGLGAGWQVNEHEQYGIDLPPLRERIDRFAEAVEVVRSLLTQERTTFTGEHYRLTDAVCEPKPAQARLPIMVGAKGEKRMLPLVARVADEWNTWGLPDEFARLSAVVDRACEEIGRDPGEIRRTTQALVFLTPDAASADELVVPAATLGTGARLTDAVDVLMTEVFA